MTLRALAEQAGVRIGTAADPSVLRTDEQYAATLAREFNAVTAENAMKWNRLHPGPDEWTTAEADRTVEFAVEHRMQVRGHTLFWPHLATPGWVTALTDRDRMVTAISDHIDGTFRHFGPSVARWDVINEPMHWLEGRMADEDWLTVLGDDWPITVFGLAADVAATVDQAPELWLNVTHVDALPGKHEVCRRLVDDLLAADVGLHGIGLQTHCLAPDFIPELPSPEHLASVIADYADVGLEVAITEMDMLTEPTPEGHDRQGDQYRELLTAALENPALREVTFWGFTDAHTWITEHFGRRDPLLFDTAYRPKPAYHGVAAALRQRAALHPVSPPTGNNEEAP